MVCKTFKVGELKKYKYVVILSKYNGKILLSRHKNRNTWETQGGHIEEGETPLDAARRELYEESGAIQYEITPLCDYWAGDTDLVQGAGGAVFKAEIFELDNIPESEMQEVKTFEHLPDNLTYPLITPKLFEELEHMNQSLK
jgi:8-oxo-dGTP diphosphatase